MTAKTIKKIHVPAYWPLEVGVQVSEKRGVLKEVKNVIIISDMPIMDEPEPISIPIDDIEVEVDIDIDDVAVPVAIAIVEVISMSMSICILAQYASVGERVLCECVKRFSNT